jgi:hypothetical protein
VAREYPQYTFVLKPFPAPDQLDTPATRLAGLPGSNCRVERRVKLPTLFKRTDLIVLLFPSTALLEALLTDRTVLVLVDPNFVTMLPEARKALERRAHVASSPAEFLTVYRSLLDRGDFRSAGGVDDTFLKRYGTHLNDGQSAWRALSAITTRAEPPFRAASDQIGLSLQAVP